MTQGPSGKQYDRPPFDCFGQMKRLWSCCTRSALWTSNSCSKDLRNVPCSMDRAILGMEWFVEKGLRTCGPIYIITAISLILVVTYTFFFVLLIEMEPFHGRWIMLFYRTVGILLLGNTLFNYCMCVITPPGCTMDIPEPVLYEQYGRGSGRFCKVCDRPKPELTHHCSVCNKCILKMDHHCPWIGNCVGFRNYRYFYLFLFYVTISCAYSALFLDEHPTSVLPVFSFMLSASIGVAVGGLFVWHTFLVATGQGTIDFIDNFRSWKEAYKAGRQWSNPHNLGFIKNFKSVFDVESRFWWLEWTLPTLKKKAGTGIYGPDIVSMDSL